MPRGPIWPLNVDTVRVDVRNDRIHVNFNADLLQLVCRFPGEPIAEGGQDLGAAFEQKHLHFARIEPPEIVLKCSPRQLRDLAGYFETGRTTADNDEREPCPTNVRISIQLGHLERAEDSRPVIECIRERFHSGRPRRVLVVPKVRLPDARSDDKDEGLLGYGPRIIQIYRDLVSRQVVKILRGIKPADIPVEQPTRFELVINLKAAQAIRHEVPAGLVLRADKLIEG